MIYIGDHYNTNVMSSINNGKRGKSPEDFLGPNSSLVNLDNLITKPASESFLC